MPETGERAGPIVEEGFTRALAARLAALAYEDLPAEVVATVKLFVLDTLGVLGGGANAPGIPELIRRLAGWERGGPATVLVGKARMSPPSAALANAASAHALDFDDQHDPARVHSYCVVLPAALATAEASGGASGRTLLLALAVSAELHARLGLACYNSIGKGWMPTALMGTLAAAVAAGRVLGLDAGRLTHAVGIAYSQAAGNAQSRDDAALSKRLAPGYAARAGVLAAHLAADGLTGPHRVLEGEAGLFRLFERGEVRPEVLTEGLGREWRLREFSMKPYPCCRCSHTVIDLGLELRAEGIGPDSLERAEVYMSRVNHEAVRGPYRPEAASVVHAQFNAAYALARALGDGRVDLASFAPASLADERIAALARRIDVRIDPAIPETATEPARVVVHLKDGRRIERRRTTMRGSPAAPMSGAEARAKFASCLRHGLKAPESAIERLAETVLRLERLADARDLVSAFPDTAA
ncbi:MAG: MmgE/PrpD family protein [Proteobacteria bacterium]|nr:MmgE/PrpD family protein [Pseudomonadota bacterium]